MNKNKSTSGTAWSQRARHRTESVFYVVAHASDEINKLHGQSSGTGELPRTVGSEEAIIKGIGQAAIRNNAGSKFTTRECRVVYLNPDPGEVFVIYPLGGLHGAANYTPFNSETNSSIVQT